MTPPWENDDDGKEKRGLIETSRLCDVWSYFIDTGISKLEIFEELAGAFPRYAQEFHGMHAKLKENPKREIYDVMGEYRTSFHPFLVHFVATGEETKDLSEILKTASAFFEKENYIKKRGGEMDIDPEKIDEIIFYRSMEVFLPDGRLDSCEDCETMEDEMVVIRYPVDLVSQYVSCPQQEGLLKRISEQMKNDRKTLCEAIKSYPGNFTPLQSSMIRVGCMTDTFGSAFGKIARHLEKRYGF